MEKLFELHTEGRFDLLVLDTPPTRNALDFLDAPEAADPVHRGPLAAGLHEADRARRRRSPAAAPRWRSRVCKRIVGFDLLADLAEFFNAFSGMVDGFQARAKRVNELLADPRHLLPRRLRPAGRADRRGRLLPPQAGRGEAALRRRDRQQGPLPGRASCAATASDLPSGAGREARRRGPGRAGRRELRRLPGAGRARRRATSSAWPRELRAQGVIRVPYLDEDVHDLAGPGRDQPLPVRGRREERTEIAAEA